MIQDWQKWQMPLLTIGILIVEVIFFSVAALMVSDSSTTAATSNYNTTPSYSQDLNTAYARPPSNTRQPTPTSASVTKLEASSIRGTWTGTFNNVSATLQIDDPAKLI